MVRSRDAGKERMPYYFANTKMVANIPLLSQPSNDPIVCPPECHTYLTYWNFCSILLLIPYEIIHIAYLPFLPVPNNKTYKSRLIEECYNVQLHTRNRFSITA
jgi:hypothetical protein